MTETTFSQIVAQLQRADHVVIMTGAGVSAESGIPTFRDAMDGHWSKYDPTELATPMAFQADPARVTRWYDERRMKAFACDPNAGHHAIAAIEREVLARGARFTLITQNVDGLHQRAGSQHVVEVHGSIARWRCTETGEKYGLDELPRPFPEYPPPSPAGGMLRPDVVWFHEALPEDALVASGDACMSCDLYMAAGTSGVVWPVAGFVKLAREAMRVELNLKDTPMTDEFSHTLRGTSGALFPALAEAAFGVSV